jgi:hypothetical protein
MVSIYFRLTKDDPSILLGCDSLIFEKLIIRKGDIENLEFELSWKELDLKNLENPNPVSRSVSFIPASWVNPLQPESKTNFPFSKVPSPMYILDNNLMGVRLTAFSRNGEAFDLDIHLGIESSIPHPKATLSQEI